MKRAMTCWQCKYVGLTKARDENKVGSPDKNLCEITRRWGSLKRGYTCERFEYRQLDKSKAEDGIEIKNRQPLDYRTERQWMESGRKLKDGAIGKEMYASRKNMKMKYRYYLVEETEEI